MKLRHGVPRRITGEGRGGFVKNLKMKAARVRRDWSQSELAERVGVTRQTIGMIEAGRFNPSLARWVAICRALGTTLDDLVWEEDGE